MNIYSLLYDLSESGFQDLQDFLWDYTNKDQRLINKQRLKISVQKISNSPWTGHVFRHFVPSQFIKHGKIIKELVAY